MPVKIDMDIPKNCNECKFKKSVGEWQWDCFLTEKLLTASLEISIEGTPNVHCRK